MFAKKLFKKFAESEENDKIGAFASFPVKSSGESAEVTFKRLNDAGAYNANRFMERAVYYERELVCAASDPPLGAELPETYCIIVFSARRRIPAVQEMPGALNGTGVPWSVGHFVHRGTFFKNGEVFDADSLSVLLVTGSLRRQLEMAGTLCFRFGQFCAFVKTCRRTGADLWLLDIQGK